MVSGDVSRVVAVLSLEPGRFQLQSPALKHYTTQTSRNLKWQRKIVILVGPKNNFRIDKLKAQVRWGLLLLQRCSSIPTTLVNVNIRGSQI